MIMQKVIALVAGSVTIVLGITIVVVAILEEEFVCCPTGVVVCFLGGLICALALEDWQL